MLWTCLMYLVVICSTGWVAMGDASISAVGTDSGW